MNKPKRSNDKYWTGTRKFDDIQFISDLEDYIFSLEEQIEALAIPRVSNQREQLLDFIKWIYKQGQNYVSTTKSEDIINDYESNNYC